MRPMSSPAGAWLAAALCLAAPLSAQTFPVEDSTLRRIWTLGMDSSHTWELAQTLTDSIGPRLNGSPGHRAWRATRSRSSRPTGGV